MVRRFANRKRVPKFIICSRKHRNYLVLRDALLIFGEIYYLGIFGHHKLEKIRCEFLISFNLCQCDDHTLTRTVFKLGFVAKLHGKPLTGFHPDLKGFLCVRAHHVNFRGQLNLMYPFRVPRIRQEREPYRSSSGHLQVMRQYPATILDVLDCSTSSY